MSLGYLIRGAVLGLARGLGPGVASWVIVREKHV